MQERSVRTQAAGVTLSKAVLTKELSSRPDAGVHHHRTADIVNIAFIEYLPARHISGES